jgi:ketosteroid isomerase-like protein
VWSDDDEIVCIHPGGPRVIGAAAIRASFDALLSGGGIDVVPDRMRRLQTQGTAVHHVLERIRMMSAQGPQTAWVMATNVYIKSAQGWRLVLHHASSGSADEVAEITEAPSTLH